MILRLAFFLLLSCLSACRSAPDADVRVEINRYDRALLRRAASPDSAFLARYADFHALYTEGILQLAAGAGEESTLLAERLSRRDMQLLYDAVDSLYDSLADIEADLSAAFARYRALLPADTLPARLYAHVSGLRQQVVNAGDMLSVSLDHYLGADFPPYAALYHPYQLRRKSRQYIVPDVLRVILYTRHPLPGDESATLLRHIIYEGKVICTLQRLLPALPVERLLGYTAGELAWCRDNEAAMWNTLLRDKTLYATSPLTIERYMAPAPFTAPLSAQSPGQAGRYIGWRIVSEYLRRSHADIAALWSTDENEIIKKAKYKG